MKRSVFLILLMLFMASPAATADGVKYMASRFSVQETAARLENILTKKGMTLFARIKHSEGAMKIGIDLPETELIIFGNPKVGSPLIKCRQSVAIDLPQKMLIWQDENGKTWISYNDSRYLEKRHNIKGCEDVIVKIGKALDGIAKSAASE